MSEKRMLIVDAEAARKLDENRGDLNLSEFINFLIDSRLKADSVKPAAAKPEYITQEDFTQFQQGIKDLLRNFMEFFLSYGLELGQPPDDSTMKELGQQLKTFVTKVKPPTG